MKIIKMLPALVAIYLLVLDPVMGQNILKTPWTDSVGSVPLNEYPRPTLVRDNWVNLNGNWKYSIQDINNPVPHKWQGEILVPFPVESYLSGVKKKVLNTEALWYKTDFTLADLNSKQRIILHFGAIDWRSVVFINKIKVKEHMGGYTGFSVDVTPYVKKGNNELVVQVVDPTDEGDQPRGKQVNKPGGIYYTSVTGIWQTVWYEIVPESYIKSYETETHSNKVVLSTQILNLLPGDSCELVISSNENEIYKNTFSGIQSHEFKIENPEFWSPDSPFLYNFSLTLIREGHSVDQIEGYFALRDIEVRQDDQGIKRIFLNNKEIFLFGPLDQGYWPDGLYTAPTEKALLSDIVLMKEMGFNSVRKHVKVEPERWYYHCDKLGLLVWQDMPSGYGEIVPVADHEHSIKGDWLDKNYDDVSRSYHSEKQFRFELEEMVNMLKKHPSIGIWVPFNESWGQFNTNEILEWTKQLDPSRIVDGPSGWIDRNGGDLRDYHLYGNRLKKLPLESSRAIVVGEFGGLGYHIKGNSMSEDAWSYQGVTNSKQLKKGYEDLIEKLKALRQYGYAGAIYTQLTDVETEINGLITYDRKVVKISAKELKFINEVLLW